MVLTWEDGGDLANPVFQILLCFQLCPSVLREKGTAFLWVFGGHLCSEDLMICFMEAGIFLNAVFANANMPFFEVSCPETHC